MQQIDLPQDKLYIAGEWRTGRGAEIVSNFPADGSLNRVLHGASVEDVDLAIERAADAAEIRPGATCGRTSGRRTSTRSPTAWPPRPIASPSPSRATPARR